MRGRAVHEPDAAVVRGADPQPGQLAIGEQGDRIDRDPGERGCGRVVRRGLRPAAGVDGEHRGERRPGRPEDIAEYARAFAAPGAMRAGLADYRASFPADAEHDDADFGRRLAMPVYLLWGAHSFLQSLDPVKIWADYAENVTGSMVEDCGHFLAEEQPRQVLAALQSFLDGAVDVVFL